MKNIILLTTKRLLMVAMLLLINSAINCIYAFEKPRVFVLTDIENEPDDAMSMVRFLLYANEFDIEGLIASAGTFAMEAQKKNITNQVEMSFISVKLTSEPDAEVFGVIWRPLYVVKQSARDALEDLKNYVETTIGLLIRLPVILLKVATYLAVLFVIFLFGRKIFRWLKRKYFSVV